MIESGDLARGRPYAWISNKLIDDGDRQVKAPEALRDM